MNTEYELKEDKKEINVMGIVALVLGILGLLTVPCFGIGGILCVASVIMGIVSFRKGVQKGFGIASIGVSIVGLVFIVGGIFIFLIGGTGIVYPSYLAYVEKTNIVRDEQCREEVEIAMNTALVEVIANNSDTQTINRVSDGQFHRVSSIPDGRFKDSIEDILDISLDKVDTRIKGVRTLHYKIEKNKIEVELK